MILILFGLFVVCGLCYYVVHRLAKGFDIPDPLVAVADVALLIIFVLALLGILGVPIPSLLR